MQSIRKGFTLVELLIAVALLAMLSAIAIPMYNGYVQTSREGSLTKTIYTIEVFQEEFRLLDPSGCYAVNLANAAAINAAIGWQPQTDDGTTYVVTTGGPCPTDTTNTARGASYRVSATHPTGTAICRQFPDQTNCTPVTALPSPPPPDPT